MGSLCQNSGGGSQCSSDRFPCLLVFSKYIWRPGGAFNLTGKRGLGGPGAVARDTPGCAKPRVGVVSLLLDDSPSPELVFGGRS